MSNEILYLWRFIIKLEQVINFIFLIASKITALLGAKIFQENNLLFKKYVLGFAHPPSVGGRLLLVIQLVLHNQLKALKIKLRISTIYDILVLLKCFDCYKLESAMNVIGWWLANTVVTYQSENNKTMLISYWLIAS